MPDKRDVTLLQFNFDNFTSPLMISNSQLTPHDLTSQTLEALSSSHLFLSIHSAPTKGNKIKWHVRELPQQWRSIVTDLSSYISATVLRLSHQTNDTTRASCLGTQRNIVWSFWRRASLAYDEVSKTQQTQPRIIK